MSRPLPLQFFVTLCVALGEFHAANAHPVSHTDAWIRAGSTLEVRLNVFLDDVARHQGLPLDREVLAASAIREAVAQHSQTLTEQLQIFDASGRPLNAEIIATPRWNPPENGVRLEADASLKLTWVLRYSAADHPDAGDLYGETALTFLHSFTHESLQQPGELRLHVLVESSGRRIDAVVRPSRPHTIVLPSPNELPTPPASADELSGLVARLTLTRLGVVLELTAPLLLCDDVWNSSTWTSDDEDRFIADLPADVAVDAQRQWVVWCREHIALRIDGNRMSPAKATGALLSLNGDEIESGGSIPLIGLRAGVRMIWQPAGGVRNVQVTLKESPGDFDALVLTMAGQGEIRTSIVPVRPAGDARQQPAAEFNWVRSPLPGTAGATDTAVGNAVDFNLLDHASLWTRRAIAPLRIVTVVLCVTGFLAVAMFVIAGRSFSRRSSSHVAGEPHRDASVTADFGNTARTRSARFLAVAVIGIGATAMWFREPPAVDAAGAQQLVQGLLDAVYRGVMLDDEQDSVDRLSLVLLPDAAEEVYLSAVRSLSSDPTGAPVVEIQSVKCEACIAVPLTGQGNAVDADCRWVVCATVTHWGHSHQRNISLAGKLILQPDADRWKLADIRLSAPPEIQDLTVSQGSSRELPVPVAFAGLHSNLTLLH